MFTWVSDTSVESAQHIMHLFFFPFLGSALKSVLRAERKRVVWKKCGILEGENSPCFASKCYTAHELRVMPSFYRPAS